jgi:RNA polymerase sigma-70 factor (ECF subfamily)
MKDHELLEGLVSGTEQARQELVRRFERRLHATACHFLGFNDPEAEDMVQESLLIAFKDAGRFEGRSSLYTWLNHICVNLCFARVRSRKRQCSATAEDMELLMRSRASQAHQEAEEAAVRTQRLNMLGTWIPKLKAPCQSILGMRFFEEKSLNEIRLLLRVPLGTVASRLARCQQALKKIAEREG